MTAMPTPDALDSALQRLQAGDTLPDILADHESDAASLEPLLRTAMRLTAAQDVVLPLPEAQRADRNRFLAEIRDMRQLPVSPGALTRLRMWIARPRPVQQTLVRKEKRPLAVLLLKMVLIFGLSLGSAGGTAALTESSLPGSALYPVKLAVEELMVQAVTDPSAQASLWLAQAQARAREMVQTVQDGGVPDDASLTRLRVRIEHAFSVAGQMDDPELSQWLVQAQQSLRTQEQVLLQAGEQGGEQAQVRLHEATTLTQQAQQMVEAGLQDPQTFRHRRSLGATDDQTGQQEQRGPQSTPAGPGEPGGNAGGTCTDCTPVGDENKYGPQPSQPGPGEPGGNADGTCTDCTPVGDENKYGPQPSRPGPGEPGGNVDGTCTDCTPVGDQHQYGSQPDRPNGTPTPCPNCEYNRDTWMYRYGPQAGQYEPAAQPTSTTTVGDLDAMPTPGPQSTTPGQNNQQHGDADANDDGGGSDNSGSGDSGGTDQSGGSNDNGGGDSGGSDQGGGSDNSGGGDSGGSDQGGGSGGGGGSSGGGGGGRSK